MIITIKTLQQQTFKVEIDPSNTVLDLKAKIKEKKGDGFEVEHQKLIYTGKILQDAKTLQESNIESKNFIVVMVTKPKSAPASEKKTTEVTEGASASTSDPKPTESTATASSKPEEIPKEQKMEAAAENTQSTSETESTAAKAETESTSMDTSEPAEPEKESLASHEGLLVTGDSLNTTIQGIMDMGFARSEVEQAMRASFNNPDRAVQYLLGGIPASVVEPVAEAAGAVSPAVAATTAAPSTASTTSTTSTASSATTPANPASNPSSGQDSSSNPLAFLVQQPQFQQMRQLIQQNQNLLPAFLQQMRSVNPELFGMITANQERFIEMLNDPDVANLAGEAGNTTGGQSGGTGGGGAPGPQEGTIQVTPEEKQAIDRLKALGFSESMCVQAYFACDKNEDLAANFLLQNDSDNDE